MGGITKADFLDLCSMRCDNCATDGEIAHTLTTYVESDPDARVDLHFCSTDCLRVWT